MAVMTGLSGNEIYCLKQKGYVPGDLVIGNSVFSMGLIGSIGSGLKTLAGGEVEQVTSMIHEGREASFQRMMGEATQRGGSGITGVTNELIMQAGNIEFLSVGSCLHRDDGQAEKLQFSSSADGQELYCQMDCGFHPSHFVFGNVAYSIGVGGGLGGALRSLSRGEVVEYSNVFNQTRHLALQRISQDAMRYGANAVVGIETSIIPFQGMQEMVMIGTAATHPALGPEFNNNPITSDLTNQEMWNLISMGYMPLRLILGVSVYSLGVAGGISAMLKGFSKGEITELSTLIYEAREKAIDKVKEQATQCGADDVVGLKSYVYQLGGGLIEFMVVGTAVKKMAGLKTVSPMMIAQAIISDKDTFANTAEVAIGTNLNEQKR
jgi:uncharacterized protein YbjQ (UPF0145 family)